MIARYSRKQMTQLWSDENRFETWLRVELAVLSVLESEKKIPAGVTKRIQAKAKVKVDRILDLEKTLKHDVIAFTTSIAEQVGDVGRFFHFGLTSSDVVDTALSLLLKQSLEQLLSDLDELDKALVKLAKKTKKIPSIGRTHGVHAEPTSFGLRFLGWVAEFRRQKERLQQAMEQISVGKLSGAVGCYGALSPKIEKKALQLLGLEVEDVSTQVLPRDRHAQVFQVIAGIGCSIERAAVELRHLQRTEVNELEEEFSEGQKGSSAMPHKKNPITAENLTGCARILRGYAFASLENVALWHERDISHSSVERVIGPDATTLLDYMLCRFTELVKRLNVKRESIEKNLQQTKGIFFSGHVLLKCVEKGMLREDAYRIVQKAAHDAWSQQKDYRALLGEYEEIREKFSDSELKAIFDVRNYLQHVDIIYQRVLGDEA